MKKNVDKKMVGENEDQERETIALIWYLCAEKRRYESKKYSRRVLDYPISASADG